MQTEKECTLQDSFLYSLWCSKSFQLHVQFNALLCSNMLVNVLSFANELLSLTRHDLPRSLYVYYSCDASLRLATIFQSPKSPTEVREEPNSWRTIMLIMNAAEHSKRFSKRLIKINLSFLIVYFPLKNVKRMRLESIVEKVKRNVDLFTLNQKRFLSALWQEFSLYYAIEKYQNDDANNVNYLNYQAEIVAEVNVITKNLWQLAITTKLIKNPFIHKWQFWSVH